MTKPEPVAAEDFTWGVQLWDGRVLVESDGLTWSSDVDTAQVAWLWLVPLRQGLGLHRLRVPAAARAWFTRRRVHEGVLGVPASDRRVFVWTGFGWRQGDQGPSSFFGSDGSSVSGVDEAERLLTEAVSG